VTDIRIVRTYPHLPTEVWRAVTDPELVPRWTATGQGARPVGFAPEVGNRFRFEAKPMPGWSGIVECEVLEVAAPSLLSYSWLGDGDRAPTRVTYRIEPDGDAATRFTYEHTGFTGLGGFAMATLLGRVRRRMLTVGLPAVLAEMDADIDTGDTAR
jgi:uncharacterized protein YndB with AHSA1/START domain